MPSGAPAELQLLLRLVMASALAAMRGWERQQAGKPAGLRTHTLVGLAAALYTTIGTLAAGELDAADPGFRADPIRSCRPSRWEWDFSGAG